MRQPMSMPMEQPHDPEPFMDTKEVSGVNDHIPTDKTKHAAIQQAIASVNAVKLVELANSSGGLLDDDLRKGAWPILLGVNKNATEKSLKNESWREFPVHEDEEQVEKDVDRAFVYYPTGLSANSLSGKRTGLSNLITKVLRTYPMLCYFQGYHDIATVLLLVLDEQAAYSALVNLSLFRIRDYMLPNIRPAEKHLVLIPTILRLADPALFRHISAIPVFYALAGTLTLYAHDIPVFNDISRLYDFLLAHEPIMAIYLFASIIIQQREKMLSISPEDTDMMHYTLAKLTHHLELETLIAQTLQLFESYPPERLPGRAWSSIPHSSVLKTSRNIFQNQSVSDAKRFIEDQKRLLAWQSTKHKAWMYVARNRRPIISVSSSMLAVAFAWWLRRNGHDAAIMATILRFSQNTWPS